MFYLWNTSLRSKPHIAIDLFSPLIQTGLALGFKTVYHKGKILWLDKYIDLIHTTCDKLNLSPVPELPEQQNIFKLLGKNRLLDSTALIKTICFESDWTGQCLTLTMPYKIPTEQLNASVHNEPVFSSLEKYPLTNYTSYLWQDFYAKKHNTQITLKVNHKQQIISATGGNILAVKYKTLYFVHRSQPYFEHFIQKEILKNAEKIGFKKVIDKNKGLPQKFLQQADEVIYVNDLLAIQSLNGYFNQNGTFFKLQTKGWAEKIRDFMLTKLF
jgi:branched-subunit amino acid aminotransferase/4-amino-4-deoxychorismate lyase